MSLQKKHLNFDLEKTEVQKRVFNKRIFLIKFRKKIAGRPFIQRIPAIFVSYADALEGAFLYQFSFFSENVNV